MSFDDPAARERVHHDVQALIDAGKIRAALNRGPAKQAQLAALAEIPEERVPAALRAGVALRFFYRAGAAENTHWTPLWRPARDHASPSST